MKFYLQKVRDWSWRYLPAEAVCTITSIIVAFITNILTNNLIATAYAAALSETVAYYTVIITRDLWKKKKTFKIFFKQFRNMIIEFGFSEFLDSFIIRPFFMYIFPILTGNLALGILLGKIVSDIIFYVPTIIMYEWRKKHIK